ncbi:hypothetical protein DK39_06180 [Salmonella enterica subsp. enterica serovar Weltevreden]|nr:hypothetical protein DK39_06180 [Salmonella enterica subsp. enterica serovar Weltevreden]
MRVAWYNDYWHNNNKVVRRYFRQRYSGGINTLPSFIWPSGIPKTTTNAIGDNKLFGRSF